MANDATTNLLLEAIKDAKETSVQSCGRIEARMDEGFQAIHGRVNGIAESFAGLKAEHDRIAPLHKARMRPESGDSVAPSPRSLAPTGRDWSGFGRVLGWIVAAAAALIGIAAQVVR